MQAVLAALALAAQPAPDDGPLQTAPREASAPDPAAGPLDEKRVEVAPARKPSAEGTPSFAFEPRTFVDGETLQVVLGQRALFRLDDKGLPVLAKVEEGKLADAHPEGEVTEAFEAPPDGQIAAALDGSAEKRATVLKVWNHTGKPLAFRAIALVMRQGAVAAAPAPPICALAPNAVHVESWPRPIVAVGLGRFQQTPTTKTCE